MQGAEIELKFPVADLRSFQRTVESLGFPLETPRTFEQNTLFDTQDRALRSQGQILRVRNYGSRCTVTHKRTPPNANDQRYKTRIETETDVTDCEATIEIFEQLGYVPVFRYEKYRTEWTIDGGHLVLDETPIGIWAELEGPPEWIDSMLAKLGIDIEDSITLSYGRLFLEWKDRTGHPAEHMTFEIIETVAAQ